MDRTEYLKQYRIKNREFCRKATARWKRNNIDKVNENARKWKRENPVKVKLIHRSQVLKQYGLTITSFNELLESQRNRCAICMTDKPGGFANQWAVDHNHLTGRTRGILCNNCNKGLGHFKDSILYLVCAKNYLERYQ